MFFISCFEVKKTESCGFTNGIDTTQIIRSRGYAAEGNEPIGGPSRAPCGLGAGVMKSWRTTHIEPQAPGKQWDAFYEAGQARQSWAQLHLSAERFTAVLTSIYGSVWWVRRSRSHLDKRNEAQSVG